MNWREFKAFADQQPYRKVIFRGQELPWRLRSAFHRTGRADLQRFLDEDMKTLFWSMAGRTRHQYSRHDPDHNGSMLHLVQHHGYPTPLLDWSFSPYVAAFCAFRRPPKMAGAFSSNARIFIFDHLTWERTFPPVWFIATPKLHLSVLSAMALDNDRAGPQQALSLVTNLDDLEGFISYQEATTKTKFLTVIDIDQSERDEIMTDLARMGISAASMFPGLDGLCEDLTFRMFPGWA